MRLMIRAVLCGAALAVAASVVSPRAASAQEKRPLDYRAYDGWKTIARTVLTDDGKRVAYALVPQDGEPVLVTRDLTSGVETRDPRGTDPAFAADGSFVAFTLAPKQSEREAERRKPRATPTELPSGLGIRIFAAPGTVRTFENVKAWKHAKHGSRFIASWGDPAKAEVPKGEDASPAPVASPTPAASPDPKAAFKKKHDAKQLTVLDVASGTSVAIPDVTDFAMSADEAYVAYAVETKAGTLDGVYVRSLAAGTTQTVLSGSGRYKQLTFAPEKSQLAFVSDEASYATDVPRNGIYTWEPGATVAMRLDDPKNANAPSENRAVRFSRDGARLFYGVAAPATPQPSATPVPIAMDLWNYHDLKLQSQQKIDADAARKASDYVVTWLGSAPRTVPLGEARVGVVEATESATYALLASDIAHRMASSWNSGHRDFYAVDLHTGARRLLVANTRFPVTLAEDGALALAFDDKAQRWYGVRTADAKRTMCVASGAQSFGDVLDDHPDARPPYGAAGFTADGTHAVVYDRFDAWSCDLRSGAMKRLTDGASAHVRYRVVSLDPEERALPATLTFSTFHETTKAAGMATLAAGDAHPHALPRIAGFYGQPVKAKNAATVVVPRGSFTAFPDLYQTDTTFARFAKISDANPQAAQYRWGTSRLVHYTSTYGTKLDGILLVPDALPRGAKAPMLVYFYERFSDDVNRYRPPGPGTSPNLMRYVSNGYVVFIPDIAYKVGYPGRSALAAILPGVVAAEKAMNGAVDDARVGIAGHSWAAYQIAYMLTKTKRFRAAEAGAAVANMTSAYGGIRWGTGIVRESQYEVGQSRLGATPWDRPDLYLENSAIFHIRSIATPYLTIANDADDAVPWYQGIEFFTAMRRLNKEAYMFVYNNEVHNLRGRENQKHWTVHMDEYFDHFLKGAPLPQWMSKGVDYVDRGKRDVRGLFGEETP